MISDELITELTAINNKILSQQLQHPAKFALALEELAARAWEEASNLGSPTWVEAEEI